MRSINDALTDLETTVVELGNYVEGHIEQETLDGGSPDLMAILIKYKSYLEEILLMMKNNDCEGFDPREGCARMRNLTGQFNHLTREVKAYTGH